MIRRVRFVHQGQGRTPGGSSAPKHGDLRETKGKQDKGVASCAATPDDAGPQCGPKKQKTRAFDGLLSSFQGFCAISHVTSNMGDGSRFDVLLPSMLTAATNSAVSTVAWQKNSWLFCKRGKQRCQNSNREKGNLPTAPVIPVFRRVSRCVRFCGGSPMVLLSSRQTAVLGLWGRLSTRMKSRM